MGIIIFGLAVLMMDCELIKAFITKWRGEEEEERKEGKGDEFVGREE